MRRDVIERLYCSKCSLADKEKVPEEYFECSRCYMGLQQNHPRWEIIDKYRMGERNDR